MRDVESQIRRYIAQNFMFRDDDGNLPGQESLLEAGLIDSTGVLELVGYLETNFGIPIDDADIVPENLDSIDSIVAYVERKRASASFAA